MECIESLLKCLYMENEHLITRPQAASEKHLLGLALTKRGYSLLLSNCCLAKTKSHLYLHTYFIFMFFVVFVFTPIQTPENRAQRCDWIHVGVQPETCWSPTRYQRHRQQMCATHGHRRGLSLHSGDATQRPWQETYKWHGQRLQELFALHSGEAH